MPTAKVAKVAISRTANVASFANYYTANIQERRILRILRIFANAAKLMFLMFLCLKNSGRREHELMSKNSGRRGRKWTYVLMSKKRWRELRKICVTLRSLLLAIVTHQVYKKMRLW